MDTMKTFGKYVLWIILFWAFSNILIHFGLNSTYKSIEQKDLLPAEIEVIEMKSTVMNCKTKIKIKDYNLSNKFLKIDLYSEGEHELGTNYIEIGQVNEGEEKVIEKYIKVPEVKKFNITIVDEPGESTQGLMDIISSKLVILGVIIRVMFV